MKLRPRRGFRGKRPQGGGEAPVRRHDATPARHARHSCATKRDARATSAPQARRTGASRTPRRRIMSERIGHALRMLDKHLIPGAIERRAGKALAQPVRARPRHASCPRRKRDAAGIEQGGEEDALPGGRPMGADRRCGRIGMCLLFHPTGWSRGNPTFEEGLAPRRLTRPRGHALPGRAAHWRNRRH